MTFERWWLRISGLALLGLAYFPARFVWDVSAEYTRGVWAGLAFVFLVALAAAFLTASRYAHE